MNKTTLLAIVLLLIIGGLGYFMFQAKEAAPDGPADSSMAQTSPEVQSADDFNDQTSGQDHAGHNHTKVSHTHADGVTHDHSHDDNVEDDHYHDPHP